MRAPIGTRIEEAGKISVLVNAAVRGILPGQVRNVIDNCGLPVSGINEAYSSTGTIGSQDCDIDIASITRRPRTELYRQVKETIAGVVSGYGVHFSARRYHREDT